MTVGEPQRKSPLHWVVPYDVKDQAGNKAATVWRNVVVEEVNLNDVEAKILADVQKDQSAVVQRAVDKALKEDRVKREKAEAVQSPRGRRNTAATAAKNCPVCPKCECSGDVRFDESFCDAICETRAQTCARRDESAIVAVMMWMEDMFPPTLVPVILLCAVVAGCVLLLRWTMTLLFNPRAYQQNQYNQQYAMSDERGRDMQGAVTYHQPGPMPPTASLSTRGSDTFMTPPQHHASFASPTMNGQGSLLVQPREENLADSIYAVQPIITPSRRGDGVRQRSPYNFRDH